MDSSVYKKIFVAALVSILLSAFIYIISFTKPFYVTVCPDSFYGIISIISILFFISAFWILTYWNMDKLQKEPLYAIFKSYFSTLFIHFFLISIFNKAFPAPYAESKEILSLIKFVLIPLFTLCIVFDFSVFKLPAFDEAVDSLIYGGFVGIGLGSAIIFEEILQFNSVSLQYLVQSLVLRILLCSSVCSLAGLLLNRLRVSSKIMNLIFSVVILFLVFSIYFILDTLLETNIRLAQIDCLKFLISVLMSLIIFFITVFFISRTVSKEFKKTSENGIVFFRICGILVFIMIMSNALYVQTKMNKTIKHYSINKEWTYELPKDFVEEMASDIKSLFGTENHQTYQRFKGNGVELYVSFYDDSLQFQTLNDDVKILNSWNVSVSQQKDCFVYHLQKEKDFIQIQIESEKENDALKNGKIINLVTKTLHKEAAHESK